MTTLLDRKIAVLDAKVDSLERLHARALKRWTATGEREHRTYCRRVARLLVLAMSKRDNLLLDRVKENQ